MPEATNETEAGRQKNRRVENKIGPQTAIAKTATKGELMKRIYALWLAIALSICLMGSSNSDEGKDAGDHYQGHDESSRFYSSGYNPLNIPVGHYPASGECRIWYPDLFPGKQPPPGDRESLRRTVPPGALLILHPENDPSHVHVIAYDELRPCIVRPVREFEIKSGVLVRIILDR